MDNQLKRDNKLFLDILNDLREKTAPNTFDKYKLTKACGLIRQLYFDDPKLLSKVNAPTN